jgi:hypothetical protein
MLERLVYFEAGSGVQGPGHLGAKRHQETDQKFPLQAADHPHSRAQQQQRLSEPERRFYSIHDRPAASFHRHIRNFQPFKPKTVKLPFPVKRFRAGQFYICDFAQTVLNWYLSHH